MASYAGCGPITPPLCYGVSYAKAGRTFHPLERISLDTPRRILLIRPSALGDVCRSVPVLASLRARWPDAAIEWLVQDDFAPAIEAHPALSRVVPFPRKAVGLGKLWHPAAARTLVAFLESLAAPRESGEAKGPYDLVLDCQGLGRSAFFAWCTRAPRRVGYANAQELGSLAYTERCEAPRELHTVDRMLRLAAAATGQPPSLDMRLATTALARDAVNQLLGAAGAADRYALIAPTSRWPGKRWPAERFAELIRVLLERRAVERVVIAGGKGEQPQCPEVLALAQRDPRVLDLVGKTSIAVLLALVERAAVVVANDSAAVHMAVGFGRPLVGLYGPTRVDLVGPYRRERDVIQAVRPGPRNQHKDEAFGRAAMEAIGATLVIDAVLARLAS